MNEGSLFLTAPAGVPIMMYDLEFQGFISEEPATELVFRLPLLDGNLSVTVE
jgi:hypothetical protein